MFINFTFKQIYIYRFCNYTIPQLNNYTIPRFHSYTIPRLNIRYDRYSFTYILGRF